ncbi:hypothetical protein AM493_17545 [Flavobacterium akiainvivens]|uniref:Polyketide cyclase n=1 Tax=Flavobacterium akiainvivens TaxID=1202724 RepID=A0A0M8MLS4_9FLAO|nr:SRPBCC family protein [Flavobacterium akiainvivens]KOS08407.1 hypothetical protein AM493_17545 [Flavobacterium akiainvivens]SFQ23409.1 Polyketide cyclase / dehydrase and lipid transport [Flavobacterium akiainvivens]
MKIVKKILIGIAALIALLLIIALFMDKKYEVRREVVINKPKAEVFNYIKLVRNQDNYSIWNMADPNKKVVATGEDGTVGFKYYWKGNDDVGEGTQEITGVTEGQKLDFRVTFKEPFEDSMDGYLSTEDVDGGTKTSWVIYGESSYPFNIMNPMMDGMLGKDLQANLDNLKKLLESK